MRILLVDDDPLSRKALADFLMIQLNHDVTACDSGIQALRHYSESHFPLVISDIRMQSVDGIELLRKIKQTPLGHKTHVILITGYATVDSAVKALRAGAYDYLLKPIDVEELAIRIERIEEWLTIKEEHRELSVHFDEKVKQSTLEIEKRYREIEKELKQSIGLSRIGIFSETMKGLIELAAKLHKDPSVPALIQGETGTGKEIIARLIHYGDGGAVAPFISINCTAISPNLFESELFGYAEGAFTGAKKSGSKGKFELAMGGTLFLDEIGDMPLEFQPKLLRVLDEKSYYRVGGLKKIKFDGRIICATNRDLKTQVTNGHFRSDLYYRMNVGEVFIPPLRERREEIAPLAQLFLEHYSREKKKNFKSLKPEAIRVLENHSWPGNIRELQNTVERVVLLYDDPVVLTDHLKCMNLTETALSAEKTPGALDTSQLELPEQGLDLNRFENELVERVLKKFNGNKTRTAEYLGLTRSALRSKIRPS